MHHALDARVRKLESRLRLLWSSLAGIGLLLLIGGSSITEQPATITCRQLQVVDDNGGLVAMLGVDADGSRGLFVYDGAKRVRLATIHDDAQTAFYAFDSTGTVRIGVAQFAHGGGGVALHGPDAKGAAVLYLKEEGSLTFYDRDGKTVGRLPE